MVENTFDFSSEVIAYREPLRYYALSLTKAHEEANDLVQETMLKAFTYKNKFEANSNLKAWLYTIMRNIFINHYRRSIKTRTIVDYSKDTYYLNIPQSQKDSSDPESALRYKQVYEEMDNLAQEFRVPLHMYFEGYKYKEIADELSLPLGTVKSRIFLARKHICGTLSEYVNH
jgi:RNA polymerase sigma factor (sigma-70 family)